MNKKKKKRLISILICFCVIALGVTYLVFYARKREREKSMTDSAIISKTLEQGDRYIVGLQKQIEEELNSDTTTMEGVELEMTISEMYPSFKEYYINFYIFDYLVNNVSVKNGYDVKFSFDKLYYQNINLASLGRDDENYTQYLKAIDKKDGPGLNIYMLKQDTIVSYINMDIEYSYKHNKPLALNYFQIVNDNGLEINTFNVYFEENIVAMQSYKFNCSYENLLEIKTSDDDLLSTLQSGKFFKGNYNKDNKYRLADNTCIKFSNMNWVLDQKNIGTKELILSSIKNINYVNNSDLDIDKNESKISDFITDATTYPDIIFHEIKNISNEEEYIFEIHKGGFNNYKLIDNANKVIDTAEKNTGFNEFKEFLDSDKYDSSKVYSKDISYEGYIFEKTFINTKNMVIRHIHSEDEKIFSAFKIKSLDGETPYEINFGKVRKEDGKIYMTLFEKLGSKTNISTCVFSNITLSEIYEKLSLLDDYDNLTDVWDNYEDYVESSSLNCDISSLVINLFNFGIIKK